MYIVISAKILFRQLSFTFGNIPTSTEKPRVNSICIVHYIIYRLRWTKESHITGK